MFDQSLRHLNRYKEIMTIIMRHGLGGLFLNPSAVMRMSSNNDPGSSERLRILGIHLRQAFEELGPAFIKIGQLASSRSDILPLPIVRELALLQDQVTPNDYHHIQKIVEWNYGKKSEDLFREFQAVPVAAASIGQVHYAVLKNGNPVAVKILKPGIKGVVQTDLEIFQTIVSQINQRTNWGERYPLQGMLEEFAKSIQQELDYRYETAHMDKIRQILRKESNIVIPKLYPELSNECILVMEYLKGEKINEWLANQPLNSRTEVAKHISRSFLIQIFGQGYFHADPHPGNFLMLPDNRIGLLDFGIVGKLSPKNRIELASLFNALAHHQISKTVKIISDMGIVPQNFERELLEKDISEMSKKYFGKKWRRGSLGDMTNQFFQVIYKHHIHIPQDFILVGKSLGTLEGITNKLAPDFSLTNQARPYMRSLLLKKYLPHNL